MAGTDEMQGGASKATVTSQRAQQIIQQYQQYKQSGGQAAPNKAPTPTPSQPVSSASRTTVTPQINISQAQLQKTNALRAQQDLPPLQEVENVRVVQPTHGTYGAGPQPERVVTPNKTPDSGVLTGKSAQIQDTHNTINQITTDFTNAKQAGVKEIQVKDASGNVIGTVNPQNVPQARLQYLNLTKKGAVKYEYTTTSSTGQTGVTSTLTTYQPSNIVTAFTGGALGGFAEAGLIGLGLVAKLTGKEITIPGTNYTAKPKGVLQQAQEKVQKTFGQETLDKMISGQKVDFTNPIELASLTGLGASIIATGGVGGAKAAIMAPSRIVSALRSPKIASALFNRDIQETELQNIKVLSTKSSTGVFGPEGVQTRGTAKFGEGGISSSSSGFTSGGTTATITPKGETISSTKALGVFGKTETTGKGTTGVFKGDVTKGIVTSTPDLANQKLEYISGLSRGEKGSFGGGKTSTVSKGSLTQLTREKSQLQKPLAAQKQEPLLKQKQSVLTKQRQEIVLKEKQTGTQGELLLVRPVSRTTTTRTTSMQKQRSSTALISKQTQKIKSATVLKTGLITKQVQQETTIPKEPTVSKGTTIPDTTKRLDGLVSGGNIKSGALGRVGKSGSRKGYVGNVPLTSIVGTYNRSEISYGKVKTPKAPKPSKLSNKSKQFRL